MSESKYLNEIFATARTNGTCFCVTPNLSKFEFNNEMPLKVIPDNLRLRLTIINKGGNRLQAQFDSKELALIERKFNLCTEKMLLSDNDTDESNDTNNIAYTTRFYSGSLKGKSPAEILNEKDGYDTLVKQYNWLKENLSKYPNNKKLMEAIIAANNLKKAGQLNIKSSSILLYKNEYRYMTGLEKNTRNNYSMSIQCNIGDKKSPYIINIKNDIFDMINGNPSDSPKQSMSQAFGLTESEFSELIESCKKLVDNINMILVSPAFKYYREQTNNQIQKK